MAKLLSRGAGNRLGKKSADAATRTAGRSEIGCGGAVTHRVARREERARYQATELAELRIHVRLIVVAGGERHLGQRLATSLQHAEHAAEAHHPGIQLGRKADLLAERRGQTRFRPPGLGTQGTDRYD